MEDFPLYIGAIIMCIGNKHLKDKVPRGNGTICRVLNIKSSNKMHQVTNAKSTTEGKCGQSMQHMLNMWNANM